MDILARIVELRNRRGWTEWRLSEESGVGQSTISAWYQKNRMPSISSLESICNAFGITLVQFFAEDGDTITLTAEQREMIENWNALSRKQKDVILSLIKNMPSQND